MPGINRVQDSVDVVAGFFHISYQRPRWATAADRDSGAHEAAMNCCPPWTGEAGWRSARPGLFTGIFDLKLSLQSSILTINLLLRGRSIKSGLVQTASISSTDSAWLPSETQGPGTYMITVVVTDNNPPAVNAQLLCVTNSFTVIVREVNVAPVLQPIAAQFGHYGSPLSVHPGSATDRKRFYRLRVISP